MLRSMAYWTGVATCPARPTCEVAVNRIYHVLSLAHSKLNIDAYWPQLKLAVFSSGTNQEQAHSFIPVDWHASTSCFRNSLLNCFYSYAIGTGPPRT
jgi:hypothetical protein